MIYKALLVILKLKLENIFWYLTPFAKQKINNEKARAYKNFEDNEENEI